MDIKRRNARLLVLETGFFGVLSGIVGAFLSIYALRLGATDQDIGLLTALPALVTLLFLIPAGRLLERYADLLRPVLVFGFWQRAPYALLAFVAFLPAATHIPLLVTIVTLGALAAATGTVAFTVMFGAVVSEADRPRLVARRNLVAGLSSAVAAVLGGWLLAAVAFPWNYLSLFLAGFAFTLVSLLALTRLIVPPVPHAPQSAQLPLADALRTVWAARPFVRYTTATFIASWGIHMPAPLYALYWVRVLDASEAWIGVIATVGLVVSTVVTPLWGRFAERFGNGAALTVGATGLALFPIATGLSPTPEFLLAPAILGGLLTPPWSIGFFNTLFEVIPGVRNPTFIAVHTAVMNLAGFLAPLAATVIFAPWLGIGPALVLCGGVRLLGGAALFVATRRRASAGLNA